MKCFQYFMEHCLHLQFDNNKKIIIKNGPKQRFGTLCSQSVVMNSFSSESSVSDLLLAFKALFDKIVHRKEGKECGGKGPEWT